MAASETLFLCALDANGNVVTGSHSVPHAVSALGSNSYNYDCNDNQITRNVGGQYTLNYDAENRLVSLSGAVTASFVYDGDGQRVKSTVNGTTTYFIGAHYEVTGSTVTKYYFAGTQRVAMRKYSIPQSMTVENLVSTRLRHSTRRLGEHLGFTSITTDNTGARVSEMRYKPCHSVTLRGAVQG